MAKTLEEIARSKGRWICHECGMLGDWNWSMPPCGHKIYWRENDRNRLKPPIHDDKIVDAILRTMK